MKIHTNTVAYPNRIDITTPNPLIHKILKAQGYNTILELSRPSFASKYKTIWRIPHLNNRKLLFYLKFIDDCLGNRWVVQ